MSVQFVIAGWRECRIDVAGSAVNLERDRQRGQLLERSEVGMEAQEMKVTLVASTGARIDVSCEDGLFHARPSAHVSEPQTCLGVDLFEVIAELADLDLDDTEQAAEAISLADQAQRRLRST